MANSTKVTRIKADDGAPKKSTPSKAVSAKKVAKAPKQLRQPSNGFTKVLFGIGGYFKGAWTELKQVRWPNRKATWSLTFAVLLFSVFFIVLIVLLDIFFKFLFEQIIA